MTRVLLKLVKNDKVKYLSHRDVIRAFELALRRAEIPVAYSEGFNPRVRMSFGSAIGVGVTSDDERILLDLASPEDPFEILRRLNDRLPEGLRVSSAEEIPEGVKSPISTLNASRFRIDLQCGDGCEPGTAEQAVREIMESSEVRISRVREGKTRELDIRPYVSDAAAEVNDAGMVTAEVTLKIGSSGGAGPQDFVQALRRLMPNLTVKRIHRLRQFRAD